MPVDTINDPPDGGRLVVNEIVLNPSSGADKVLASPPPPPLLAPSLYQAARENAYLMPASSTPGRMTRSRLLSTGVRNKVASAMSRFDVAHRH